VHKEPHFSKRALVAGDLEYFVDRGKKRNFVVFAAKWMDERTTEKIISRQTEQPEAAPGQAR
jgi:hypothetical protein